jgi:PilZ domain
MELRTMEDSEKILRRHRVRTGLPVRVRGMSAEQRFFDEETGTLVLSANEVMLRIHALPELDSEIHITSLKNGVAGIFRVIWLGAEPQQGFHELGLEKIDSEGDLWEMTFPPPTSPEEESLPTYQLECRRCHQQILTMIPEAEAEFIRPGFRVARPCERCKATTGWEFTLPGESKEEKQGEGAGFLDLRGKGRAPIKIRVKITRKKFGSVLQDVCQTENLSRTGAYFLTSQIYEVGELVSVILPYKEDDVAIPVSARVVRLARESSGSYRGVAIQLLSSENR